MKGKTVFYRTLRKVNCFLMAAVLSCGMILPSMAVSRSTMDDILFDPVFYAAANPDVVQALGSSYSALRRHYDQNGKREGRAPSDMFDPHFYLSGVYPDLKAAFGTNYTAAYNHFLEYGIREGRAGSASFQVEVYKNNYGDLRNAFGTAPSDNWEYFRHWDDYGRGERRNATTALTASNGATSSPSSSTQQTVTKYVKTSNPANSLNMRSGPSTSHGVIQKLSYGMAVEVLSTSGSWSQVKVNGRTGYVSSQYLSATNSNGSTVSTSSGFVSPVPSGAKFSKKTYDAGTKWTGYHDINRNVSTNTPVYAITGGTAYFYQFNTNGKLSSYGNYVEFVSDDGQYKVRYAHLSRFEGMPTPITVSAPFPCSGRNNDGYVGKMRVSAGQTLGWVGTTGNSSGIHLHIEIYKNGTRIDPTTLFPGLV